MSTRSQRKKTGISESFLADMASLAAYEPRSRAIEWIKAGRLEEFMDWACTDGYIAAHGRDSNREQSEARRLGTLFEPLHLDRELIESRLGTDDEKTVVQAAKAATLAIEHFSQSPIEIAIRADTDEPLEALLKLWGSPKYRFEGCGCDIARNADWLGEKAWIYLDRDDRMRVCRSSSNRCWDALAMAFLVGKPHRAEMMQRAGMAPSDLSEWWSFDDRLRQLSKLPPSLLGVLMGVENASLEAMDEWAGKKNQLSEEIEELFRTPPPKPGDPGFEEFDAKLDALLAQGAPIGYYPLAQATSAGRLDMLRKLFAAGGDPNAPYKTGVPMLARVDGPKFTPEALQIWLDAGARPSMPPGSEEPFGNSWNPAPLFQFAWSGRLELVKPCFEKAQGKTQAIEEVDGKFYCTLLAIALNRGDGELAAWLIEEQGCRLDHLEPDSGETCEAVADPAVLAHARAAQERAGSYDLAPARSSGKKSRSI